MEDSMKNTTLWDAWKKPPAFALKEIKSGRMAGKTDISPQWRLLAMTEQFGQCGIGWKYTIKRLWTEDGGDGEKMAFALVELYYRVGDSWSEAIPGIGGNSLIAKERNGLYNNDEAYKMAVTDALSVAFKALGMAGNVYMGMMDSKYNRLEPQKKKAEQIEQQPDPDVKAEAEKLVKELGLNEKQRIELWGRSGQNWDKLLEALKQKKEERAGQFKDDNPDSLPDIF